MLNRCYSQNPISNIVLNRISFHILNGDCIKIFSSELREFRLSASDR